MLSEKEEGKIRELLSEREELGKMSSLKEVLGDIPSKTLVTLILCCNATESSVPARPEMCKGIIKEVGTDYVRMSEEVAEGQLDIIVPLCSIATIRVGEAK